MWRFVTPGIPDERFIRGEIPMTKEEVRAVTLAKARLRREAIVYDIGAGTGSLTVEAALLAPRGKVFAVEREPEGIDLIKQNCAKFEAENVEVISGWAPEALIGLPKAHAVIIGGSGGKLAQIIAQCAVNMETGARIVINAVTLDTLDVARVTLEENGFAELEIVTLAVTRWPRVGRSYMAKALNPVFIVSAELRS